MRNILSRCVLVSAAGGPLLLLAVGAGLSGCSGAEPTSAADCAPMSAGPERDECYLKVVPNVFKADPAAGITMVETGISDALTRDMAWYNVTKLVDPHSNKYCDRIQDQTLANRCRQVVSRPHLHRELTGQDAGGPGRPPQPGAPKPGPEGPPPGTPAPDAPKP
ncbi:MAG: hypothetical protein Q8P41_21125 [Pseudomonadota bacterium]|nr:hypothetical protein [Pseudomonadota bacterium]